MCGIKSSDPAVALCRVGYHARLAITRLDTRRSSTASRPQFRKNIMKGYCGLSVLLLALLGGPVHAACDKGVALRLAKSFWSEHKDFYYADPAPLKTLLTPDFFAVLSSEAECNADGEVCAIDADPWINAQDGEVSEPVSFTLAKEQEQGVTVRMHYLFALSDAQKEPQTVSLHFQKSGDNRCYLMDDFIPPGDGSLKQRLRQWQNHNAIELQ